MMTDDDCHSPSHQGQRRYGGVGFTPVPDDADAATTSEVNLGHGDQNGAPANED
jgi:hypothetical protein